MTYLLPVFFVTFLISMLLVLIWDVFKNRKTYTLDSKPEETYFIVKDSKGNIKRINIKV